MIVIVGNIADGMSFYGPFEDVESAQKWVTENKEMEEWLIVELVAPGFVEDEEAE